MRIWDLPPRALCRQHLLGEHRELHALWVVLTQKRKGYSHHPETKRWRGRLRALYHRHTGLVEEMTHRGYRHRTPLDKRLATGRARQERRVNTLQEQVQNLKAKGCDCKLGSWR